MSLPIVFINLDRDAERRTRLLAELQQIDMPSERFPAVWWADPVPGSPAGPVFRLWCGPDARPRR